MDLVCAIVSPATCASLSNDWSADWSKGSIGLKEQGSAILEDAPPPPSPPPPPPPLPPPQPSVDSASAIVTHLSDELAVLTTSLQTPSSFWSALALEGTPGALQMLAQEGPARVRRELVARSGNGASRGGIAEIDVLVVYPQPAADQMSLMVLWGTNYGETELSFFLEAALAEVNSVYNVSGIPVRFRLAAAKQVDFTPQGDNWRVGLTSALMNSEMARLEETNWPYINSVEALRDEHSADIVVYWRMMGDGGPSASGAAVLGGGASGDGSAAYVQLTCELGKIQTHSRCACCVMSTARAIHIPALRHPASMQPSWLRREFNSRSEAHISPVHSFTSHLYTSVGRWLWPSPPGS